MSHPIKSPRKLIEVALPLDAINKAAAKEKSIRHGHPSTLHLWWARRPLAAARAVIFAQLVNDPGFQQGNGFRYGMNKKDAAKERKRLFKIIEDLVKWENTTNEEVLEQARAEIRRSWREVCELNKDHPQAVELFNSDIMPGLHDPFAGGGSIPLEAQRLGLDAYASDLNPVAVLINKAMIAIPPTFAKHAPVGLPPKNSEELFRNREWPGASGLAEDVRRYGAWIRKEAQKRIGHLYPEIQITPEMAEERPDLKTFVGKKFVAIAWIWARTVKSPNPAFSRVEVPLTTTFVISGKAGKEVYVTPILMGDAYRFKVRIGVPPPEAKGGTTAGKRKAFRCLMSGSPVDYDYIRNEGKAGRIGRRLMAVVLEGEGNRIYLAPTVKLETLVQTTVASWKPALALPDNPRDFKTPNYGLLTFGDLFTPRQLVALTTFSDLVTEVPSKIRNDAIASGMSDDGKSLEGGGVGATAYAEAVSLYLGLGVGRSANYWSSFTPWGGSFIVQTFGRNAIPMIWDHAECNPFSDSTGNWSGAIEWISRVLEQAIPGRGHGSAAQQDAQRQTISRNKIVSTDPPYYDNIGYAELSDFFYLWLRRSLRKIFPQLLATIAVPKAEELVATPYRHGNKGKAESFFLNGMTRAMHCVAQQAHPGVPITIYYAVKQSETEKGVGTSSSGWETFLEAVIEAGLQLAGTWPMRTERDQGLKTGTNSLASSIVLVCRKRPVDAIAVSRREFLRELNKILPEALDEMIRGAGDERSPIAPVDLSQAIIGPGMAIFSKYSSVLEADGSPMSVRTALQLINRFFAEDDFDADTQFCLHWFEQHGWGEGLYGQADVLARAKATSVDGVVDAGVLQSKAGKVRLMKFAEYPSNWDLANDPRVPVWEVLHHLIRSLKEKGEGEAGRMLAGFPSEAEPARQLAYRLYILCERQGWAEDARAYNEFITSWPAIEAAASQVKGIKQPTLFGESS